MPDPITPYLISGKARDIYNNLLSSGIVTLDHTAILPQLSTNINSAGEYALNLSKLNSQWSKGDSIAIKTTISGKGRVVLNTTIKNLGGGQTENLALEQTSDINYEPVNMEDRRDLLISVPVLFDGTKVSEIYPLPVLSMNESPLGNYRLSDQDINGTIKYYGYVDRNGNWYIAKNDGSDGSWRFIKGSSDYPTNWANRASLEYNYYYNVF